MKIDKRVKDFLSENRELINTFNFTTLYELANSKDFYDVSISQITYLLYEIGIDPLQYMKSVPSLFAYDLNLPNPVIDIPDHIEYIHAYAFAGTNVTKFIAPANLKFLWAYVNAAFSNCEDLVEADFSKCDLYEEISDGLFAYCTNLKVIKFPKNLHGIQSSAFFRCTSLISIDLSNCHKLTTIKDNAFNECKNLTTVYLPNSIEHIGKRAFDTGKPITIVFDGSRQEWEDKFGTGIIASTWNSSKVDIVCLR